jgi:hypothetical protein
MGWGGRRWGHERGGPKPLHCCQVGLNEQAEIAEVAGSLASCPSAPLCLPVSSPFPRFSPFPASSPACLSRPPALPVADYVSKDDPQTRIGAILGLGIAYAGRCARVAQQTGHTQQAKPGGGGGALWQQALQALFCCCCHRRRRRRHHAQLTSKIRPAGHSCFPACRREKGDVAQLLLLPPTDRQLTAN